MDLADVTRYEDELTRLEADLAKPETATNPSRLRILTRRHAHLSDIVKSAGSLRSCRSLIAESSEVIRDNPDDEELVALAREELEQARADAGKLEEELKRLLLPKDPEDEADTIVEIRAGTGGDEASLFAADLYRMYCRYAELKGWKTDPMNTSLGGQGGMKEVVFGISGDGVYSSLEYEAGVHRGQRVAATEASGRIHTSAASVAVLPEAEDVEIELSPQDLRIDVFRSTGPGGQSVNTTDSAVRITHVPTGLVVSCQDEKSQHKNKAKAMRVLKARLVEHVRREAASARSEQRRTMVGSGDRSEKIRTYNFPQNRVTDHRIGLTLHALEGILSGDLDKLIIPLKEHDTEERLKQQFNHDE